MKIPVKAYPSDYIAEWLFPERGSVFGDRTIIWGWITHPDYNEDDYIDLARIMKA